MSNFINNIKRTAVFSGKTGGVIGFATGFVGDFLQPITPVGIYVAGGAALTLLGTGLVYAVAPAKSVEGFFVRHELDGLRSIWFLPMATALILLAAISFSAHRYSSNFSDDGGGVMGTLVPEVKELQEAVGILEEIRDTTKEMVNEQRETNSKLATSVELQQNIATDTSRIAQQQELTNRAVVWNQQTLNDALVRGDLEVLQMFHEAGEDLRQVHFPSSSAPLAAAMIVNAVRNNHTNIDKVLGFLTAHNYLDTENLYDSRSGMVPPAIDALWQKMELQALCNKYSISGKSFDKFQDSMLDRGYLIPDDLANIYGSDGVTTKCSFIGAPSSIKTTLLIEALYAHNQLAVDYLRKQDGSELDGYIQLTYGARILMRPELILDKGH